MGKANDSILVTPGSGATVATHTVSSKEHQCIIPCDAQGHLWGDRGLYAVSAAGMAKSASKKYLSVFNADSTGVIVDIVGILICQENTAAVTGLVRGYRVHRITAHSAGTTVTPVALDTGEAALDADITCRSDGLTATTSGDPLAVGSLHEDEIGGGGPVWLFNEQLFGQPIVCRQDQGVVILQDSTAGAGNMSAIIYFRQR